MRSLTPLLSLALLAPLALSQSALAQNFPTKPVRIILGFTPGGGVDINARLAAPKLGELLGQQVIVENKPGAGTNIANEFVAKAAPDGYTVLMTTAAVAINMSLYKKVNYDALRDFAPVGMFSASPNVLVVSAGLPARNVAEFLALARSQPGKLNFSSAGAGTTQHLSGELLNTLTKIKVTHIPYKGSAPALTAVISGEVQLSFANIPAISAHVKSGKLRALALTGGRRNDQLPDVPTLKESGVNMDVEVWYGVFAPAATPRAIVNRLSDAFAKTAHAPEISKRLIELGAEPRGMNADDFTKLFRAEVATWADVVKASGASADE
jgi:tripartite-type tricarboxylate transporter receptor subunit TctC